MALVTVSCADGPVSREEPTATPWPIPSPTPTFEPAPKTPTPTPAPETFQFTTAGWKTDFERHSVPLSEIFSGGPGRDEIAPIDAPMFISVAENPRALDKEEPVIVLEIDGASKAYPLRILIWHEIVNDEIAGVPVVVTYCPLCNTAIAFDRRVNDVVLDFGTTGNLRNSDLVMWDRQTESWWQQITGEAIVGELTGAALKFIPSSIVSWKDFSDAYPDATVLSRETGHLKDYDSAPYGGYDQPGSTPMLFFGEMDERLDAMERIVGISIGNRAVAYPFSLLNERPVINDTIGGRDIVIIYKGGTLSPFPFYGEEPVSEIVGSALAFHSIVDQHKLTFKLDGKQVVDEQTRSTWNLLGQALDGPLEGSRLEPVVHANHFWFAWAVFHPDTEIRTVDDLEP